MTFSLRVSKSRTTNSQPPFPSSPNFPYKIHHQMRHLSTIFVCLSQYLFIHQNIQLSQTEKQVIFSEFTQFFATFLLPTRDLQNVLVNHIATYVQVSMADVSFSASSRTIVKKWQKMSAIAFLFWWKSAVAEIWVRVREENTKFLLWKTTFKSTFLGSFYFYRIAFTFFSISCKVYSFVNDSRTVEMVKGLFDK